MTSPAIKLDVLPVKSPLVTFDQARQPGQHPRPGRPGRAGAAARRAGETQRPRRPGLPQRQGGACSSPAPTSRSWAAPRPDPELSRKLVKRRPRRRRRLRASSLPDRRRHRRRLHGRRSGAGPRLRLPPRRQPPQDRDRPARDEDRPHPRFGRHAAPDARRRPQRRRRDDLRPARRRKPRGRGRSASSSTSCRRRSSSTRRSPWSSGPRLMAGGRTSG